MVGAVDVRERDVQLRWEQLLESAGIKPLASEVRLGALKIDAIGRTKKNGSIEVVEFKVNRHTGAIGQLLVYMHAVRRKVEHLSPTPKVTGLLATTHLDEGVLELLRHHGLTSHVRVLMITHGRAGQMTLAKPEDVDSDFRGFQHQRGKSTHEFKLEPRDGWTLERT